MNRSILLSDQSLTWSAHGRSSVVEVAQASRPVAAANAGSGHAAQGLAHRALQALRQTWLQMCRRPRSWSQVLSVRELSRAPAANGLRAAGALRAGQHLTGGLSARARDPGRDLRDQPGALTSSRDTLSECGGRDQSAHHYCRSPRDTRSTSIHRDAGLAGHPVRQYADRQYVGRMDRCTGFVLHHRGERS